jgi:hypothetical protein
MISIFELIRDFDLTPQQLAKYLWQDIVFCGPDEECHYLNSLTPEHLEALAELIAIKASQMRLEQSEIKEVVTTR